MGPSRHPASEGYGLQPDGDALGLSCGPDGPCLGPIPLLTKVAGVFAPWPTNELDAVLGHAFGRPVSSAGLASSLAVIARALNAGDLARAMIATQQMRLAPLTHDQARRAVEARALLKINPLHRPAGSPNGTGGQFAPKDDNEPPDPTGGPLTFDGKLNPGAEAAEKAVAKRLSRAIVRRGVKAGLRYLLKPSRVAREGLEALSNVVPGLDVIGDAMAVKDGIQTAAEMAELTKEVNAALEFIKKGPQQLDALKINRLRGQLFSSFKEFKKLEEFECYIERVAGKAPDGWEYHHIVEQSAKFSDEAINSVDNVILIPKLLHEEITAEFARAMEQDGVRTPLRRSLKGKSFDEQHREGVRVLRELGLIQ